MTTATEPAEEFRRRLEEARRRHDHHAGRAGLVSNLRLLAFAAAIGALVWAELRPEVGGIAFALFGLSLLAFFALIVRHSRLTAEAKREAERAAVNREALARLERDWDALPSIRETAPPGHAYARDLDLFGHGSLARFLGTAGTAVGRDRLHRWLLERGPVDEVRRRQEAVRELAPRLDLRQEIQVAGRLAGDAPPETLDRFFDWAEARPWLLPKPALLWAARLVPLATLTLLVLHLEGTLDRPWWLITLAAGVLLSSLVTRRVHALFDRASAGDAGLRHYADLVGLIQDTAFESPALMEAHADLTADCDARRELDRLGWLTELADMRHGGLFYVLVHWPTLWDIHVLWGLERWQRGAGRHVRQWVRRVAELDAMSALAAPAHDEAGWSFPDLHPPTDGEARLSAQGLAHPLLSPGERVPNDVTVGPPGSFLMVTGSNMSGKSTLLRAIGINAVLAQAGGPVAARSLAMPPLAVQTSMRVEDSLERGVSLFMAELQRLKQVVDAADATTRGGDAPVLYLLDEILHGTNTAERQVAVRKVLGHLLGSRSIGAISTHDLELAAAEPLASAVVPVHFRETVTPDGEGPAMTFDYRLRDGIATSTNALKLVRLVGLG